MINKTSQQFVIEYDFLENGIVSISQF